MQYIDKVDMQIMYQTPVDVKRVSAQYSTRHFDLFLFMSNLISLQATILSDVGQTGWREYHHALWFLVFRHECLYIVVNNNLGFIMLIVE